MKSLTVANTTGREIATRNLEIKHEPKEASDHRRA